MKLLFVCTANIDRGPTGEDLYKDRPGFEARSAGTEEGYAEVPLTKELIEWADVIFCMEPKHRRSVLKLDRSAAGKTLILNIPDKYYRGDPELVESIKRGVERCLLELSRCPE